MAKQPKGELVVAVGFNYDLLETKVAERVRTSADRIRERVKKTVEDISDQKEQQATLEHQVLHDGLTGLPNRVLLHDRLSQAILIGRREGNRRCRGLLAIPNVQHYIVTAPRSAIEVALKESRRIAGAGIDVVALGRQRHDPIGA